MHDAKLYNFTSNTQYGYVSRISKKSDTDTDIRAEIRGYIKYSATVTVNYSRQ